MFVIVHTQFDDINFVIDLFGLKGSCVGWDFIFFVLAQCIKLLRADFISIYNGY